jgi:hypothetical protein
MKSKEFLKKIYELMLEVGDDTVYVRLQAGGVSFLLPVESVDWGVSADNDKTFIQIDMKDKGVPE